MQLQQIDYAPALPNQSRRRMIRRIAFGIIALILVGLAIESAPAAWQHVQILYWQHRAMNYSAPADQVVYDNDPADAAKLRGANPSLTIDAHGDAIGFAKPWDRFYQLLSPPGRLLAATLFLHQMRNAEGESRLVVVEADSSRNGQGQTSSRNYAIFRATVFRPGGAFSLPQEELDRSPERLFSGKSKWCAGQIDPENPTHFTIQGVWNGTPVSVDGWLRVNDQVQIDEPFWPSTSPAPSSSAGSPPSVR